MRRLNEKVFDKTIDSTATWYTSIHWDERLGNYDALAIFAVATDMGSGRSLTIAVEHSADGVKWFSKNATPEISGASFTNATPIFGADISGKPSLNLVRLRILLSSGKVAVKIYATVRDSTPPLTGIAKLFQQVSDFLRAEVAADMAELGRWLQSLNPSVKDELKKLLVAASQQSDKNRLAYVYERLSPTARNALAPVRGKLETFFSHAVLDLLQQGPGWIRALTNAPFQPRITGPGLPARGASNGRIPPVLSIPLGSGSTIVLGWGNPRSGPTIHFQSESGGAPAGDGAVATPLPEASRPSISLQPRSEGSSVSGLQDWAPKSNQPAPAAKPAPTPPPKKKYDEERDDDDLDPLHPPHHKPFKHLPPPPKPKHKFAQPVVAKSKPHDDVDEMLRSLDPGAQDEILATIYNLLCPASDDRFVLHTKPKPKPKFAGWTSHRGPIKCPPDL